MKFRWAIGIITLIVLVIVCSPLSQASHILGGDVCYSYLGYDSTRETFQYELQMCLYRDTSGSTCPPQVDFEIFENDTPDPSLDTTVTLTLSGSQFLENDQPGGCTYTAPVGVEVCCYKDTVGLDSSRVGYHLVYQGCCRDVAIDNTVDTLIQGMTFYNYIAPTRFKNSSPCFQSLQQSFLCVGDTTCFAYEAVEADGDSVAYSFEPAWKESPDTPYSQPVSSPNLFDTIFYKGGYSGGQPFGSAGDATIDPVTGLGCYTVNNSGSYLLTVEAREYRNDTLLSRSRREIQLFVDNCPPAQEQPRFSRQDTSIFNIYEGDSICIPVTVWDSNGDSLILTGGGPLLDSSRVSDPAAFSPVSGDSLIRDTICWKAPCGATSQSPYFFYLNARDNGCPRKQMQRACIINVRPYPFPADSITGPDTVCIGRTGQYMIHDTSSFYQYDWQVSNGTITQGDASPQSWVQLPGVRGPDTLRLIKSEACMTDTLTKTIMADTLGNIPLYPITNYRICEGEQDTVEWNLFDPSLQYQWTPDYRMSDDTVDSPVLSPDKDTTYQVEAVYNNACRGQAQVNFRVDRTPTVTASPDQTICRGDTAHLQVKSNIPNRLGWSPSTSLSDDSSTSLRAYPTNSTTYIVQATDTNQCTNRDSVRVEVGIPPTAEAGEDVYIIKGQSTTLKATGGINYIWESKAGGTDSTNPIVVSPPEKTTYAVTALSPERCKDKDSVTVHVSAPVKVPSAFSPNNDGVNDRLRITGTNVESFELTIYNRWGKQIFYTQDKNRVWDGTGPDGHDQPTGNYVYYLRVTFLDGETVQEQGNITLIR